MVGHAQARAVAATQLANSRVALCSLSSSAVSCTFVARRGELLTKGVKHVIYRGAASSLAVTRSGNSKAVCCYTYAKGVRCLMLAVDEQDDPTTGPEVEVRTGLVDGLDTYTSVARLDPASVIVCFAQVGLWGSCAKLLIHGMRIEIGPKATIVPVASGPIAVGGLSDDQAAVCYETADASGGCVVVVSTGRSLLKGPQKVFSIEAAKEIALVQLRPATALLCYTTTWSSKCAVMNATCTSVDIGPELTLDHNYPVNDFALATVGANTAQVCFSNMHPELACETLSASETKLSRGTARHTRRYVPGALAFAPLDASTMALCHANGECEALNRPEFSGELLRWSYRNPCPDGTHSPGELLEFHYSASKGLLGFSTQLVLCIGLLLIGILAVRYYQRESPSRSNLPPAE